MEYHYDRVIHTKKMTKSGVNIMRIIGLIFFLLGIGLTIINISSGSLFLWIAVLILITAGIILFFPNDNYSNLFLYQGDYFLEAKGNTIKWKLGGNLETIDIKEIGAIFLSSGTVILKTTNNNRIDIPVYKINNKEKHDEFVDLIKELKKKLV